MLIKIVLPFGAESGNGDLRHGTHEDNRSENQPPRGGDQIRQMQTTGYAAKQMGEGYRIVGLVSLELM